ncbi:MAG: hypothetical protein Kow0059_08150 [Candidatus Sumerlaeia bacterium]
MPIVTIAYGALLMLLGFAGHGLAASKSATALIPAFAGLIFVVLGVLALKPSLRRDMMHAAAGLSLLAGLALVRGVMKLPALWRGEASALAVGMQIAMGLVSLVFLALCIRSFVMVRRARAKKE